MTDSLAGLGNVDSATLGGNESLAESVEPLCSPLCETCLLGDFCLSSCFFWSRLSMGVGSCIRLLSDGGSLSAGKGVPNSFGSNVSIEQ